MSNGSFNIAEKIIQVEFRIHSLDPKIQKRIFDMDDDWHLLEHGVQAMKSHDPKCADERLQMLKSFL